MRSLLPFDAHNHIHMGPSAPIVAILGQQQQQQLRLGGVAIMSTHTRDFVPVVELAKSLPRQVVAKQQQPLDDIPEEQPLVVVPGFGIHPWWLADLTDQDWQPVVDSTTDGGNGDSMSPLQAQEQPQWLAQMEDMLLQHPQAMVGEIGLDGFHFDATTGALSCPLERQSTAFALQMQLAARLKRVVSIHCVQCFGLLLQSLSKLKKEQHGLPHRLYFHAFGGKVGTVDQLLALCGRKPGQVYFGFAPVINFRSPKTAQVMKKVGLERLVLESDHEDAALVQESIRQGIAYIADTFAVDERTVIETTTENARILYGLSSPPS